MNQKHEIVPHTHNICAHANTSLLSHGQLSSLEFVITVTAISYQILHAKTSNI